MSLFDRLLGIVGLKFQIGGPGGVAINSVNGSPNGTTVGSPGDVAQDTTGAFWLKATGTNTNTGWVMLSAASTGLVQEIRFPVGLVTVASTTSLPAGTHVFTAQLDVTAPYPTTASIQIGQTGALSEFQAASDNFPTTANLYSAEQDTITTAPNPVLVTVTGAPTAGAATCIVRYCVAPNA
jgi:hypothetical protein